MIEIWLFDRLVVTLPSALSVVLVLVALAALTYVAGTLAGVVAPESQRSRRVARNVGLAVTALSFASAIAGLRVGAAGSGGEVVETALVSLSLAIALGVVVACLWLALARSSEVDLEAPRSPAS